MSKEKCSCGCGEELDEELADLNENFISDDKETFKPEDNCDCEDCKCENCTCEENKDYLKDLLRVQAEFDNYRKRMNSALGDARQDGFIDAIVQFLPAIDSFKMATEYIQDKNTLMGIKFIEKGILDTLSKMGVEEIIATGKFNADLHQAIESENQEGFESGDIIKEAYKGFTYKGKVIRYSQVIVQK